MTPIERVTNTVVRELANPAWVNLPAEVASAICGAADAEWLLQMQLIREGLLDRDAFLAKVLEELEAIGMEGPRTRAIAGGAADHAARVVQWLFAPSAWSKGKNAVPTRAQVKAGVGKVAPRLGPPIRPIRMAPSPAITRDAWVDGMRLRYFDVPCAGAKTTVLLIHGHSSCLEEHTVLLRALSARYRVIACDLPGCGYSAQPVIKYTLKLYEDVLLHLMDALGVASFVPLGGSLGGNLSLRLALRCPDRVPRTVAWAPAGWLGIEPALSLARALDQNTFWTSLRLQAETWYSKDTPNRDRLIEESLAYRQEVFGPGFLAAYKDIATEQVSETMKPRAKDIRVPVKLLVGENDHALDMVDHVKDLATLIPGASLVVVPGMHSVADEETQLLLSEIFAFVP